MSVFKDIEQLLNPGFLTSFRENMPPVQCIIWKGGEVYQTIRFDAMFPFDQLDDIKRMICSHFSRESQFHPKFMFVGVPLGEAAETTTNPALETQYLPLDYLWFPPGSTKPSDTFILRNPRKSIIRPDSRFVSADGSFPPVHSTPRGRSTIERVFLKVRDNRMPTLHVFTLQDLVNSYRGVKPISEADWNQRFRPYFPDIPPSGSYAPTEEDLSFARVVHGFIRRRESSILRINRILSEGPPMPEINVTGVRMLRLILQKPQTAFEGCESLFYRIKTTEHRPFSRLMPAEGTAVTKVLVRGALPIPALEDPEIMLQWAREISPTPGKNYMYLKYVHRKAIGALPPIYGTIRIFDEGTADITLQPPKQIRKMDPTRDFSRFSSLLEDAMAHMPQRVDSFQLGEAFLLFSLKTELRAPKFTRTRLRSRLPFFQAFFQEIKPLPEHSPVLSIRYKCVSEFATEDKQFTFLSQYMTQSVITGDESLSKMLELFQMEFQVSQQEARETYHAWLEQKGVFTVAVPEEDEFMESFNPGIDIHIFEQHPYYHFQVNRIDSYETFERIFTLMGLMFLEDDDIFKVSTVAATTLAEESRRIEARSLHEDIEHSRAASYASDNDDEENDDDDAAPTSIPAYMRGDFLDNDEVVNESPLVPPATATATATAAATPATAPAAPAATAAATPPPMLGIKKAVEDEKTVDPRSWFINKLQELDDRLFTKGSYSRTCAANEDRQPAILTKSLFERMVEEYEPDVERGEVFFRVLPLEGDDDQEAPVSVSPDEIYTIMKFGTDPADPKYYFCPEFYCLADEIMIRKRDFEATRDREGRPKPKNSCPFCYGLLITDKTKAVRNHTVYRRKVKKGSKENKVHGYIGFAKAGTMGHPEGFSYPCCHTTAKTLRITDPAFAHFRKAQAIADDEDDEETDDTMTVLEHRDAIEYGFIFQRMANTYILGPLRRQLEPGKVGAVPTEFDSFFQQNSEKIIKRTGIRQDLRPKSEGFLRIGTDNSVINDALLGVIAPIILKNSIAEVKERIIEAVNPRVFVAANFGNLVHEFYDPTQGRKPTQSELSLWASSHLNVRMGTNEFQIQRIYNAYNNFLGFIRSTDTRKELRHITPLLAEGILTIEPRGVNLVVIDWDIKDKDTPLVVRCPPYGVSVERHKKNDIVFISRDELGRYELFIYTKNEPAKGEHPVTHDYVVRWMNGSRDTWPAVVTQRVNEFYNQCQSRYRSLYTSESGIHPQSLLGVSEAVRFFKRPVGLVRDMYNHAVAILLQPQTPGVSGFIAIPVVDDGYMAVGLELILDWTAYTPAPADEIVKFYNEVAAPVLKLFKGYKIIEVDTLAETNAIAAVKLANGIHIPAAPPLREEGIEGLEPDTIEELEWTMDRDILKQECGSLESALVRKTTLKQVEELYQHFRISFANWLATETAGGQLRKTIEQVMFSPQLPDYEKRKRLEILLLSTLKTWFYLDPDDWEMPMTFMRKDCTIVVDESACTGTCKWTEEGPKPRCKIHVQATTDLGLSKDKTSQREVNTATLYSKRLIDELVRFPSRRTQLMKRQVSKVSSITEPIRIGDQYIIPESSPTWLNLLRMDWARQEPERARFYEEMSAPDTEEAVIGDEEDVRPLPDSLRRLFGTTKLRIWMPTSGEADPLATLAPIFGVGLGEIGVEAGATSLTKPQVEKLSMATRKTYGIINMREDPAQIYFVGRDKQETDPTILLAFLPDNNVGLLIEEYGTAYVKDIPEGVQGIYKDRVRAKSGKATKRVLRLKIPQKEVTTLGETRIQEAATVIEEVPPPKKISFRRISAAPAAPPAAPLAAVPAQSVLESIREEPQERLPNVQMPRFVQSAEELLQPSEEASPASPAASPESVASLAASPAASSAASPESVASLAASSAASPESVASLAASSAASPESVASLSASPESVAESPAVAPAPAPVRVSAAAPAPAPVRVSAAAPAPAPVRVSAAAPAPAPVRVSAAAPAPAPVRVSAAVPARVPVRVSAPAPASASEESENSNSESNSLHKRPRTLRAATAAPKPAATPAAIAAKPTENYMVGLEDYM